MTMQTHKNEALTAATVKAKVENHNTIFGNSVMNSTTLVSKNQISTQTLSFYGSDLITLKVDDVIYTAVKPIVDALGLSWGTQQRKLYNSKDKFSCTHMSTTGNDGRNYKMLCMPIRKLNGWLFSINPAKVRSDLREKVIQYQEECFEALYNYWMTGKAERSYTSVDDRTGLRNAVNMIVSKRGLLYSDAYNLVHQYMNVQHIDEIPLDKLQTAVAYCHKVVLEGELINAPKTETTVNIPYAGRWLVITDEYDEKRTVVKNIDGKNCVDAKISRQLLKETHLMADLMLELSKRMRFNDGECHASRFDTPLLKANRRTII